MPKVIFANGKDSDMYYAVKSHIPDPFFYIDTDHGKFVFLDHREFEVFRKNNKNPDIKVVLSNPLIDEANEVELKTSGSNKFALLLFQKYDFLGKQVEVPVSFPLDLADFLRSQGANIIPTSPFFLDRTKKNEEEIKKIEENIKNIHKAYDRIKEILAESRIVNDEILFKGEVVTSELLKNEVDRILLENDMINIEGIIISSGSDAAIPHHMGAGIIRPHTTIICDIFPQNRTTKYFADMTRTFLKGKPSKEVVRIYEAVLKAQRAGVESVKPGIKGSEVHKICADIFLEEGFEVGDKGFVHGTGHSFGIDIHEAPYLNKTSEDILEPGNVITVEPGLYYPEHGGIRIEDDVLVTKDGYRNLTDYSKDLIIV